MQIELTHPTGVPFPKVLEHPYNPVHGTAKYGFMRSA
jgi:hypothetical protein